ncbi:MAG: hypothetical protein K6C35_06855 [Eubacterium sp.]|nr:hypothetical protein [Eubacterium sp.]
MKKILNKKQLKRIIAFVMAIAMVITVIRVNSSDRDVKAGEIMADTSYTESDFLESKFGFATGDLFDGVSGVIGDLVTDFENDEAITAQEYTIYTLSDQVEFELPRVNRTSGASRFYYLDDSEALTYADTPEDVPAGKDYVKVFINISYNWSIPANLSKDASENVIEARKQYDLDKENSTSEELNNQVDTLFGEDKTANLLTLKYECPASSFDQDDVVVDQAAQTLTIDDGDYTTWVNSTENFEAGKVYYGELEYTIFDVSSDSFTESAIKGSTKFKNAEWFSDPAAAGDKVTMDGTYWVFRKYVTDIEEEVDEVTTKVYAVSGVKKKVNFSLLTYLKVEAGDVVVEYDPATLLAENKKDEARAAAEALFKDPSIVLQDVNPADKIDITVKFDEDAIVHYGGDNDVTADTEATFTIPADKDTNNGQANVSYAGIMTFSNTDDSIENTLNITASYLDTAVTISDVKVNGTDASTYATDPLYTKTLPTVSATVSAENNITDAAIYEGTETVSLFEFEAANEVNVSKAIAEGELTEGLHTLYVWAKNAYTEEADTSADAFKVYYDVTEPVIGNVTFSQGGSAVDLTANKLTSQKDLEISFPITEAGSGVASAKVTLNGYEYAAVLDGDVYKATVSQGSLAGYYSGATLDYVITATDNAGNTSTGDNSKTGSVDVYDERATIEIKPSVLTPDRKAIIDGDNLHIKYNNTQTGGQLQYEIKIVSEVPIDNADVVATDRGENAVTLTRDDEKCVQDNGKYTYVYLTDAVNLEEKIYSLKVETTNSNGFECKQDSKVYYVDLTSPDASLTANSAEDFTGYNIVSESGDWYKHVYVLVSGLADDTKDTHSGLDENLAPTSVTGMTEISADSDAKQYLYEVDPSATIAGTTVSFTFMDLVGNPKTLTGVFYVDQEEPFVGYEKSGETVITKDYLKVDGVVIADTVKTVNKTGDIPVEAKASDNIGVQFIRFGLSKDGVNLGTKDIAGNSGSINISEIAGTEYDGTTIADGRYILKVYAMDYAGNSNVNELRTLVIIIDSKKPVTIIKADKGLGLPKGTGTITGDRAKAEYVDPDDADKNYEYYRYSKGPVKLTFTVDDDNIEPQNIVVKNGSKELTNNPEDPWEWVKTDTGYTITKEFSAADGFAGYNVISITSAKDNSGNEFTPGPTQRLTFYIDNTARVSKVLLNGSEAAGYEKYSGEDYIVFDNDVEVGCLQGESADFVDEADVELKYSIMRPGSTTKETLVTDAESLVNGGTKTFTEDGTYYVTILTRDMAGNAAETDEVVFIIDKTDPQVSISLKGESPKTSKYFTSDVTLTVNLTEYYPESCVLTDKNGKKVDLTFKPSLDSVTAGGKYTATIKLSEEGKYVFKAVAKDKAGRKAQDSVEFIIDKTEPDLRLLLNGATAPEVTADEDDYFRTNGNAKISYKLSDDNNDPRDVVMDVEYTDFSNQTTAEYGINFGSEGETSRTFTEDGVYLVTVTATDLADMKTTKKTAFVIDSLPPEIEIEKVSGTSVKISKFSREYSQKSAHFDRSFTYGEFYNSESVSVKINIFDNDIDMAADPFTVYDNGEAVSGVTFTKNGTIYTATITVKGEGKHHITVSAVDRAENESTSNGVEFTIDTTDPDLKLTLNGETEFEKDLRLQDSAKIGYILTDANADLTDVKITYVYTPAGGSAQAKKTEELYNNATRTFPDSTKGEGDGRYEVFITAIDKAGNSVVTDTAGFVIDSTVPELDLKLLNSAPAKMDKYNRTYKPAVEGHFTTEKNGYTYGQYYKEAVKVKVTVFDYDPKSFKVTDNGNEVSASFTDNGNGEYTAEIEVSGDGEHKIAANAVDKAGNSGNSSEITFIIDTKAPVLNPTLDSVPYTESNSYRSPDAVVGITVDDDNKDTDDLLRTYKIQMSDGSQTLEDSSYIQEITEVFKYNAFYTITYKAVDRAGNEASVTIGFTIDTNGPQSDIVITTAAPKKMDKFFNEYSNTSGHFNTSYKYGQYYANSVAMDITVFDYNVESIVVTDNGTPVTPSFTQIGGGEWVARGFERSSEGVHEIAVTVTDKAGHTSTKNVSFEIDTIAPELYATLNNTSDIKDRFLNVDASVSLSITEKNKDDDVTRIVKMTRPSASPEISSLTGALEGTDSYSTEADYEITYKAVDRAGNESSELLVSFRVDKTPPVLTITGIDKNATSAEDVTVTYGMVEAFYWDMVSAEIRIYKKVDGSAETLLKTVKFDANSANSTMSETFKEDGQYRFEFTAEDKTGNKADESFAFILDENAPIIVLSGVDKYLTDDDVTLDIKIDETFFTGNVVKIEGTVKTLEHPEGEPINFEDYSGLTRSSSADFQQIFTEDGIYDIKVTSKDIAGNETVQNVQFTIDKTNPLIKDIEELANEEEYKEYIDAVNANDPEARKLLPIFDGFDFDYDADDIVVDLTTVTYQLYLDDVLYDGLSKISDGFHELKVNAHDEVGNSSERSFYFKVDTVAPVIIITGVDNGNNLQKPTTVTVSLQLAEDTLEEVTLNGSAIAIDGNAATFEVSKKGEYELVCRAIDAAGNGAEQIVNFEYGKTNSILWIILAAVAGVIVLGGAGFIILGKKKKNAA